MVFLALLKPGSNGVNTLIHDFVLGCMRLPDSS
jgi:hypothetical protein